MLSAPVSPARRAALADTPRQLRDYMAERTLYFGLAALFNVKLIFPAMCPGILRLWTHGFSGVGPWPWTPHCLFFHEQDGAKLNILARAPSVLYRRWWSSPHFTVALLAAGRRRVVRTCLPYPPDHLYSGSPRTFRLFLLASPPAHCLTLEGCPRPPFSGQAVAPFLECKLQLPGPL